MKATKHKLTPSVYVGCGSPSAWADPKISYSGPTYVTIRSEKHDSSTAYLHGKDFNQLMEMKEFQELMKAEDVTKPIAIILCDGSPDENPWFPKTLDVSIQHFKEFNFDVMFVSTLVPGMSAYSNVERRIAMADVLLPHDTFGTHLDSQRRTTDVELEKQNFKAAGKLLAEIWSELVLDKLPTVSKYVKGLALDPVPINETWGATHCHISKYFLQIAKCTKWEYCGEFRTSWLKLFPQQFLPAPVSFRQLGQGPEVLSINDARPMEMQHL